MSLALQVSSKQRKDVSYAKMITKSYDMGDPTLTKKFSMCYITYEIDGQGVAPLEIQYRIDNSPQWSFFNDDPNNAYSVTSNSSIKLKRTSGLSKTASFIFPDPSKGKKVSIKLIYNTNNSTHGTKITNFALSDISFTFRAIQRK